MKKQVCSVSRQVCLRDLRQKADVAKASGTCSFVYTFCCTSQGSNQRNHLVSGFFFMVALCKIISCLFIFAFP